MLFVHDELSADVDRGRVLITPVGGLLIFIMINQT